MVETSVPEAAQEVAESLYRLFAQGLQAVTAAAEPPPEWPRLPVAEQLGWFLLARSGPALLERCAGQRLALVGPQLAALFAQGGGQPPPPGRGHDLLWEALAKHLLCLVDCEEVRGPGESEYVMLEWLRRKCAEPALVTS